jgi:hypothetical protein
MPIVAVIGHGTVGEDSRAYLSRGGDKSDGSDRKVSIHRLFRKDGKEYIYVPDERGANHAGASTAVLSVGGKTYRGGQINRVTLSFELENKQDGRDSYTSDQLLSMGYRIAMWRKKYGNIPIFRHEDLDSTRRRDPYQLSVQDIEAWTARALAQIQPPGPTPDNPRTYRVRVACAALTDRRADAPLASGPDDGLWIAKHGNPVSIGDITGGWAWIKTGPGRLDGPGFVPLSYLEKV